MKHLCDQRLLLKLSRIPEKMVKLHSNQNLAEFVLHELSDPVCFNFKKMAFLVDNPDFDCLKGVAGVEETGRFGDTCPWSADTIFTNHMRQSAFNQRVRSIQHPSKHRRGLSWEQHIADIADHIEIEKPGIYSFNARHGNHGILIFEPHAVTEEVKDYLAAGSALLALCPVF